MLRTYRRLRQLALLSLPLAACLGLLIFLFRYSIGDYLAHFLVDAQQPERADFILVLGGDFWGPRVLKGAELLNEKMAPAVVLSGGLYKGRLEGYYAKDFLTAKGYPAHLLLVYPYASVSTVDEIVNDCKGLARLHINKIILVTSNYHSRRAAVVMRLFCPSIDFVSVPSDDPVFRPGQWRTDPSSHRLFLSEWKKLLETVFGAYPLHLLREL